MCTAVVSAPAAEAPNRRRFTREECDRLEEMGLLEGRYELIDGEILSKIGQKWPHWSAVVAVREFLSRVFGVGFVQTEAPVAVPPEQEPLNAPLPDACVSRVPLRELRAFPGPDVLVMVVEVADTTVAYDLSRKAALYARSGIPEYWVVDLPGRQVHVHRQPAGDDYRDIAIYGADESIAPMSHPEAPIPVRDLLPPAE